MKSSPSLECEEFVDGTAQWTDDGLTIFSPRSRRPLRRVLFVNVYGGASLLQRIRDDLLPPHHLWGCRELVKMGYEVAIAEPLPDFYLYRNPLPHDLRLLQRIRSWLGTDGIVYCGHNVLYWIPLLKRLGAVRCSIVSLLYAREPLQFSRAHTGIIALNEAAADHARKIAPNAKVATLAWGVDLPSYPSLPYCPDWFLSCGRTRRDDLTLSKAAVLSGARIRVLSHGPAPATGWPRNVEIMQGAATWEDRITSSELLLQHYARCAASLIILRDDPEEQTGCGFTNLLEAMAMARPVVITRTGAVPTEIDVEKSGCGLFVPPNDPPALANALFALTQDPVRAQTMGAAGRRLCESRYNIDRFAEDLHRFFETL